MDHAASGFFSGRFLIGSLTAGMYPEGWALADVPYWFLLGVLTGFLTVGVWPSLVYLMVQFVKSWILTPLVQSRSMEMSAITVLIHRVHRRGCRRLYGLLLPIPIAACIKILIQELVLPGLER